MATMTRAQRREYHAKPRRLRQDRARLERTPRRAQRGLQALEQARGEWGLPETLGAEVEWPLQAPVKRRGTIFGWRFPTGFGGRPRDELTPGRVWEKHVPGRLLGARPQQQWSRPLPRRGQALLSRLWRQVAAQSPATQRRWQGTWAADDRVFKQAGQPRGRVGTR